MDNKQILNILSNLEQTINKMDNKFTNFEKKLSNLEKEIQIVKSSQEILNYMNSSSVSRPLNSFSTNSLFGEPITVNSYDLF